MDELIMPRVGGKPLVEGPDGEDITERVYEFVMGLFQQADRMVERMKADGSLSEIKCLGVGCTACCYERVEINPAEAIVLTVAIHNLPEPVRLRVKDNMSEWMERFAGQSPIKDKEGYFRKALFGPRHVRRMLEKDDKRTAKAMFREAQASNTPCPLLVDGACSVYEHRPWNCRTWFSTEDPEHCAKANKANGVARIASTPFLQVLKESLTEAAITPEGTLTQMVLKRFESQEEVEQAFGKRGAK